MSVGFTADWLSLREPADRSARDPALRHAAVTAAGTDALVVDLGCGTGSTLRAIGHELSPDTRWLLVDNDPDLLTQAAGAAAAHADTYQANLADIGSLPIEQATLVTASALLDLVSEDWIRSLANTLTVPFYAALTYNGEMRWTPSDPRDDSITHAFNRHQQADKGFGVALGPDAARRAPEIFAEAGWRVIEGDSPWRLGKDLSALQQELVRGIAGATRDAGEAGAIEWGEDRVARADETVCVVGHADMVAFPPGYALGGVDAQR